MSEPQEPAVGDACEPRPEIETRQTLTGKEALERLRKGEPLVGVRIVEPVFRGEWDQPVTIRQSVLVRPQFSNATFKAPVAIVGCQIEKATFSKKNHFQDGLNLSGSSLSRARVGGVTVDRDFSCDNLQMRGKILFLDCTFTGRVRFWEACTEGWLNFRRCVFGELADLRNINADQGVVFEGCQFKGDFLFRGSCVEKKLDFKGSRFEGLVDLSKAKLRDFAYMEEIEVGERCRFAFLNAVTEHLLVCPEQLQGRMLSEQEGRHGDAMHEYGLLKKCYSNLHRFDMEDWAFYRFKVSQRGAIERSWRRPFSKVRQFCDWLFLDNGCGYGTMPGRAVMSALVIIAAFGLVYAANIDQVKTEHTPFPGLAADSWPNRLMNGLLLSVSAFTAGLSDVRDAGQNWMTIPLMVEALLGIFLWGLFIVAFSRKVIR